MPVLTSLLTLATAAQPAVLGPPLADETPAHVAVALRIEDQAALDQLLVDLQDPGSPEYHQWLTPEEFGVRFGLAPALYDRFVAWLGEGGFTVTRYPNRLFLEGTGTAGDVRRLFGVQLRWATADGRTFRTYEGTPVVPADLAPHVLRFAGLDTRTHHRHRIASTNEGNALGADDLRLEYDMTTLIAGGQAAAGLTTAILATQEGTTTGPNDQNPKAPFIPPSTTAIQTYFSQVSQATATYNPIVMSNPSDDFDLNGSNQEYQLDVEMQSVGAANAQDIDLVLSPSSEVFMTGAQYIVNSVSQAVAVSTSLGLCESEEAQYNGGPPTTSGSEMAVMRQAVQQGAAEGQTWFAAAGDSGADDCYDSSSGTGNGFGGGNATVDFPGTMPEIIDMGGTMFSSSPSSWWTGSNDLAAFQPETTCNEGSNGIAGGGGQSLYFTKPSWQVGVGPEASDGARDVPDLSLEAASGTPGIAVYGCGSGQDSSCQGETTGAGNLDVYGGTSVASPLAAGIFALLAGQKGCALGDIHASLYALAPVQTAAFHDITTGNNSYPDPSNVTITGFTAGPGFDLATGWGSLDVGKLVTSWPACQATTTTGGTSSGGTTGGASSSGGASTGGSSGGSTGGHAATSGGRGGTSGGSGTSTGSAGNSGGRASTTGGGSTGSSSRGGETGAVPPPTPTPAPAGGCSCAAGGSGADLACLAVLLALVVSRRRAIGRSRARA
jgi:subtilase family serine protease